MKKQFQRAEPYIFYFIVFLHCLPVLLFTFFITHDGPAHVYNAYLIKDILFHHNTLTSTFFSLRSFPEPNWTGHALMVMLGFLWSPVHAERILLLTYLILFPLAFRKSVRLTNPDSPMLSYLVFPFVFSYAFYGGLYNFMLGIPILLFAMLFLLKKNLPLRAVDLVFLFLISMLIYFSHLLIFGIFVLLVPFILILKIKNQSPAAESGIKKKLFITLWPVFLMLLPGLVLSIKFLFEKISLHATPSTSFSENLFHDLAIVLPTIALDYIREFKHGIIFGIILALLIVSAVFMQWKKRKIKTENEKSGFNYSFFWLTAAVLMLAGYLFIPDNFATGGVVKVRFSYFFFLFLILWLATQKIPKEMINVSAAIVILLSCARLYHFAKSSKQLNKDAVVFYSATELIEPNSIVLPLNYSSNWMHSNLSNYLGTDKHIIILDNYEAGREHFPLAWRTNMNPGGLLGSFNGTVPLCADVSAFENGSTKKIDYIVLWKNDNELKDSCSMQIQLTIRNKYQLVFKSLDKQLYMYKRADKNSGQTIF